MRYAKGGRQRRKRGSRVGVDEGEMGRKGDMEWNRYRERRKKVAGYRPTG